MTHLFEKLALITTTVTAAITLVNVNSTEAVSINLSGAFDSGDLNGATYEGSFSFDTITSGGTSDVDNLSINFTFDSFTNTFTDADAVIPPPLVEFDDAGNLLGLDFLVENATLGQITFDFQFTPGFFSAEDASVFYDVQEGIGGAGNIVYTPDQPPISTPEPNTVLALIALGTTGCLTRTWR